MSLLPKALVTILAPVEDFPKLYVEPLREVIVHGSLWSNLVGLCGRRPPKTATPKKKTDEDPIEIYTVTSGKATRIRSATITKADLV